MAEPKVESQADQKPGDPARALTAFVSHGVNFVVIGGLAGKTWNPAVPMMVLLEVCCERSTANEVALAGALSELEATFRGSDESTPVTVATIETHEVLRLNTNAGAIDCVAIPRGTSGYADLIENAVEFNFGDDLNVHVASLEDLIRIARATDGVSGRVTAEILAATPKR